VLGLLLGDPDAVAVVPLLTAIAAAGRESGNNLVSRDSWLGIGGLTS